MTTSETPQQRRRQRNLDAILAAALELSADREVDDGADGWSMRELADRLDYTPGALYRYFDSKTALQTALADRALASLRDRLVAVEDGGTELTRLEALGLAYLDWAATNPIEFRSTLIESASRRRSFEESPAEGSAYGVLLAAVQAAIDSAAVEATAAFGAEEIAFTIWATVHGMAVLEATHLRGFEADFATVHREALTRLIGGLARPSGKLQRAPD